MHSSLQDHRLREGTDNYCNFLNNPRVRPDPASLLKSTTNAVLVSNGLFDFQFFVLKEAKYFLFEQQLTDEESRSGRKFLEKTPIKWDRTNSEGVEEIHTSITVHPRYPGWESRANRDPDQTWIPGTRTLIHVSTLQKCVCCFHNVHRNQIDLLCCLLLSLFPAR